MRPNPPAAEESPRTFRNLRVARSSILASYLLPRPQLLHTWMWVRPRQARRTSAPTDEVIYHAWRPGLLEVPKPAADLVREMIRGEADMATSQRHRTVGEALCDLGWCEPEPVDLDALVVKARDIFPAVQNPRELRVFLERVAARRPKTVVEIGTASGGLFYCLSQLADPAARMVSIDVEGGLYGGGYTANDTLVFSTFGPPGQRYHFLRQRSFHRSTIEALEAVLEGAPVDLLVIDADHSYGGVKADFEMYSPLVAPDGVIALHDVVEFPPHMKQWREGNDVHVFWRHLQEAGYETEEIVDHDLEPHWQSPDGRLVARWPALGFGLVLGGRPGSRTGGGAT